MSRDCACVGDGAIRYRGAGVDGSTFFLSLAVYTNSLGKSNCLHLNLHTNVQPNYEFPRQNVLLRELWPPSGRSRNRVLQHHQQILPQSLQITTQHCSHRMRGLPVADISTRSRCEHRGSVENRPRPQAVQPTAVPVSLGHVEIA